MLTKKQIEIIIQAMKPYNPVKIGVFGSVARNESSKESDIDILYHFNDTIGLFKLIGLQQELQEKLNKKVDLVSEKYIHPKLKPSILKDLHVIYGH